MCFMYPLKLSCKPHLVGRVRGGIWGETKERKGELSKSQTFSQALYKCEFHSIFTQSSRL